MCEYIEHFEAIDHLILHLDGLHELSPFDMRWIVFYALATMHPEDLPQSKKEENCVALDVNIDFHKWWLVAHQHFGKIIV